MKRKVKRREPRSVDAIYIALGAVFVIWFSLLCAPAVRNGLPGFVSYLSDRLNDSPFNIDLCDDTIPTIAVLLGIYAVALVLYYSTKGNYRRKEEHGSSKWGNINEIRKRFSDPVSGNNKILTKNISLSTDTGRHMRNLNTIVIGGSGSGKTRMYCKPNIMQANTSFVILDPKGEIISSTGKMLEKKGYEIKVLDLVNMEKSHCFNPFVYLENDNDVQKLVTNLFRSTSGEGKGNTADPFWETAAEMLLMSLIFYLHYEAPPEEQNFATVMEMIRAGEIENENSVRNTPLDDIFDELEEKDPDHIALKYYRSYHAGSAKTLKSIQITLIARLEKFNLESLASLTVTDEMDLPSLGEKKTALFAIIPDNDVSFNFIVSILYTQLFQQLFKIADTKYGGALPVPVHLVMDEFANVKLPDSFDKILSVMRSRGVFVSIIIQNMAQLKALFEKQWESIMGNCDTLLYLGGNESGTHKFISSEMGKETINSDSFNKSSGRNGSYSKNTGTIGRELMTEGEIRALDNRYALLLIRGEDPIMDLKYDIMHHPNISMTTDGGGPEYEHGVCTENRAVCEVEGYSDDIVTDEDIYTGNTYELLADDEFEGSNDIY